MAKTIEYYFALSSPWTYLAGPRFEALVRGFDLEVACKPFDMMQVFALLGTKPVRERPKPIQINRLNELRRWRDFLGMPLNLQPKHAPVDQKPAARMVIAARPPGLNPGAGAMVMALANAYLRAVWAEERDIADPETLIAVANEQGFDGRGLLERSRSAEVTADFDRTTREAIESNVFGSPTWIYRGELFWGQDRLDFLARAIERA